MPARSDLISVPVRTMPASNVSSIVKSWRALRLRATVVSSPMGGSSCGTGPRRRRGQAGRTNAGPMRAGVRVLSHPQGVRLDGHLLRGGAATVLSITAHHLLSFSRNRTRCVERVQERARRAVRRPRQAAPAAATRQQLERLVERRVAVGRDRIGQRRRRRPGVSPTSWIQRLSGVSQRAIVSLNAPPSPLELLPLLDGALAERLLADERRPPACPGARPRRSRWPTRCRRR